MIETNILSSEGFIFNVKISPAIIKSCKVINLVRIKHKNYFLKKKLFIKYNKVVFSCSETMIPLLSVPFLDNQNYFFHPVTWTNLAIYTYIIDYETLKILVKNISNQLLHILHQQKLDYIIDICYNNCFLANTDAAFYATAFS